MDYGTGARALNGLFKVDGFVDFLEVVHIWFIQVAVVNMVGWKLS